jgi:hypothetical protein
LRNENRQSRASVSESVMPADGTLAARSHRSETVGTSRFQEPLKKFKLAHFTLLRNRSLIPGDAPGNGVW